VLKSVSPHVRECYELALEARRHALETTDPVSRDEYLVSEARCFNLAKSWELSERLTDFLKAPTALPKHPECPNCHVPMWLVAIQNSPEKVEYLYECKACETKATIADATD